MLLFSVGNAKYINKHITYYGPFEIWWKVINMHFYTILRKISHLTSISNESVYRIT